MKSVVVNLADREDVVRAFREIRATTLLECEVYWRFITGESFAQIARRMHVPALEVEDIFRAESLRRGRRARRRRR